MPGPALIPAAGHSSRMGRPKLLLPLGGRTILERLVAAAHEGGVERVIVVTRPDDLELIDVARHAGAEVVRLPANTSEMRQTIVAGLDWIEAHIAAADRPGFFLVPADHPTLSPDVFRTLAQIEDRATGGLSARVPRATTPEGSHGRTSRPWHDIVVPIHAGRRGHPVWIPWSHVSALRNLPAGIGLNQYIRGQRVIEIPWPTDDVLIDLDTPADYEQLLARDEAPTRIDASGTWHRQPTQRPLAVMPGSFNPVHDGHWGLASAASEILRCEVAFEISRRNVDKPELTDAEIARRAVPFAGRADLWVTRAARFVEKVAHFPGAAFVIGADTAARVVDARYHEGDIEHLAAALERLRASAARFLVAARADAAGRLITLDDIVVPPAWRGMFDAIPASRFRLDISSTQLRRERDACPNDA